MTGPAKWPGLLKAMMLGLGLSLLLAGCSVQKTTEAAAPLPREARWALLPMHNHT